MRSRVSQADSRVRAPSIDAEPFMRVPDIRMMRYGITESFQGEHPDDSCHGDAVPESHTSANMSFGIGCGSSRPWPCGCTLIPVKRDHE